MKSSNRGAHIPTGCLIRVPPFPAQLLLPCGVPVPASPADKDLLSALAACDLQAVRAALALGANPYAHAGVFPCRVAAEAQFLAGLEELAAAGANPLAGAPAALAARWHEGLRWLAARSGNDALRQAIWKHADGESALRSDQDDDASPMLEMWAGFALAPPELRDFLKEPPSGSELTARFLPQAWSQLLDSDNVKEEDLEWMASAFPCDCAPLIAAHERAPFSTPGQWLWTRALSEGVDEESAVTGLCSMGDGQKLSCALAWLASSPEGAQLLMATRDRLVSEAFAAPGEVWSALLAHFQVKADPSSELWSIEPPGAAVARSLRSENVPALEAAAAALLLQDPGAIPGLLLEAAQVAREWRSPVSGLVALASAGLPWSEMLPVATRSLENRGRTQEAKEIRSIAHEEALEGAVVSASRQPRSRM